MIQRPRGTSDFLHMDNPLRGFVESAAISVAELYGYTRIDTPTFESFDLFARTIGDTTDIVQKEMYTFEDKSGGMLTLRAEGTAPVCRAFLEHGLHNRSLPLRFYYICPVFRYERPQSGRYREHHQFGIELIGGQGPESDAEVISVAWDLMQKLGLSNTDLIINSIGDPVCRPGYLNKLKNYYQNATETLCDDCKERFIKNPLRLLDCKNPSCSLIASKAPRMIDSLCDPCEKHWKKLLNYLEKLGISYMIDHHLVRGLDYYTKTVFEIKPKRGGSQGTVLGGGRYDGLIEQLGGKWTPGIGFGSGLERLVLNMELDQIKPDTSVPVPVVVTYHGDDCIVYVMEILQTLRSEKIRCVLAPSDKSIKSQMRYAASLQAGYVVIVGQEEIANGSVAVKNMKEGTQQSVYKGALIEHLRAAMISCNL